MMLFITKKKLVKTLAEEIAYLQINADWWYYCHKNDIIDKDNNIKKQDMSSRQLDLITEVRSIAVIFGVLTEVYEEAYKIYDFRNSGKKDFVPDTKLIEKLHKEFCEPIKKHRPVF